MISKYEDFLRRVDQDFIHPLSSKVNLREYAIKLSELAYISAATQGDSIIGMVAMYCNDFENNKAYIPLVAVDSRFRGKHIGRSLMTAAISYAKSNGFKTIGIHTENPIALYLYTSLGFIIRQDTERKYLEIDLI